MIPQNLNPRQAEAVSHPQGPLLIVAGAGSGKTKTLTNRLAFFLGIGVRAETIVAITFTNKAANEMAERVAGLLPLYASRKSKPFIGTFHSLGARILRNIPNLLSRTIGFTIYDDNDSLKVMKQIMKEFGLKKEKIGATLVLSHISRVKSELGDFKNKQTGHKDLDRHFSDLYEAYEKILLKNNAFDFDDLIEKPVRMFRIHPRMLQAYRDQYRYILVDEFQDINTAQYEFIRLLGEKSGNVSVVGDDQQSIYSFRGSNPRNFLNFEKDWQGAKVILLEENYRSSANIIKAASAVIANNKIQKTKNLWTQNSPGELVSVIEHADNRGEALWVAGITRLILKKNKMEGGATFMKAAIVVLYRTNAQSRELEQALIESHIPYEIFGGIRFYDRKEIKDIVSCLRYAVNPKDMISLERVRENFLKKPFLEFEADLPQKTVLLNPTELIGYILKVSGYVDFLKRNYPNAEERIENIAELIAFASGYKDTHEFLEKIALLQGNEALKGRSKRGSSVVHLMTIHSAKGLEFDTVIVAGASEGLLPHQMSYKTAGRDEGVEEERRLMYVAMTRARNKLYLSFYGLGSRFLYEISPELIEFKSFVSDNHEVEFGDDEERYIILP
ncbi:MAG TPA: UvrD-helicase domain-containing protein [Candidatus Paceibacterota bacterium]